MRKISRCAHPRRSADPGLAFASVRRDEQSTSSSTALAVIPASQNGSLDSPETEARYVVRLARKHWRCPTLLVLMALGRRLIPAGLLHHHHLLPHQPATAAIAAAVTPWSESPPACAWSTLPVPALSAHKTASARLRRVDLHSHLRTVLSASRTTAFHPERSPSGGSSAR
jgi:hypothetical protein